jgi:hypothetical protein
MKTLSPRELRRVWASDAELFKPKSLLVPQIFEEQSSRRFTVEEP